MKKQLIIAFALCVLFLSACSSLAGTSTSSSGSSAAPVATVSTQSVCQVLHGRQTQLSQQDQVASAQLKTAQAQGNSQQEAASEKTLLRLHQSIAEVQAQLKTC